MARPRASTRRIYLRRVLLVLAVALVGYLYYHPLQTYVATKREVAGRQAEVAILEAQNARLERQLKASATPASLARAARVHLSLVKPGEQLFIVKGIEAWRKRN